MDFTKGEISELKLRLIAFAADSVPLIAGIDFCDKQTRSARGGDKPEQLFQNFTFGEIHQRFLPVSGYSLIYYALKLLGFWVGRDIGPTPKSRLYTARTRFRAPARGGRAASPNFCRVLPTRKKGTGRNAPTRTAAGLFRGNKTDQKACCMDR
jgi:hypothetical protein